MAIRSGSGSLKYPLPANTDNQASIAAAGAGGSASASAYGTNRRYAAAKMQTQAQLANSAAERQYRAMAQLEGQNFQAQSQLEAQRFREDQGELDRQAYTDRQQAQFANQASIQQNAQRFSADQAVLEDTRQSDRDLRRINAQQVASLPDIPENARTQTRQHLQRLQSALQEMVGQNWNPNDPATRDTFNQTMSDYMSVVRSIPQPTLDDQFRKNTLERDGKMYQFDPKSKQFSELSDGGQADAMKAEKTAAADQQKKNDALVKRAQELRSDVNPDTGEPKLSLEDALKQARDEQQQIDTFLSPQSTQATGGAQPESPQTVPAAMQPGSTLPPSAMPFTPGAKVPSGPRDLNAVAKPMTEQEYNALQPGEEYLTPNGELRRKKA